MISSSTPTMPSPLQSPLHTARRRSASIDPTSMQLVKPLQKEVHSCVLPVTHTRSPATKPPT